ncbi:hypothetical protein FUA48_11135 [Flavobacterium alkalisoli]|uniref:Uncharacterized protein n=1 Tax=Flavobacterium alkalisoli TaxID=2602769 RepID=A0A5B9FRX2_9FLAO|nr:hypothetical protein [Flavobacterium alkalisoli]QEE50113.1 hypothetical protein FUA48_11135 [Flavobacterium alkalisoli]
MEINTNQTVAEFKNFIENNLNYPVLSVMSFDDYKSFVIKVFTRLNELKNMGITKNEINSFINKHYSNVMVDANDNDILFERRFSAITEDIVEFCVNPFFWSIDFDVYMKKWDKLFATDWCKKV